MTTSQPKYRFLLIQAFNLSGKSSYQLRPMQGAKEDMLMNYRDVAHLLADVAWDVHPGATDPHGNWPVETREELDRKSTRLNSSHVSESRMPSSA